MPRVSVIMGAYNASTRIKRAVYSIINQSYQDWELIICDDGSTDDTYQIIKDFENKDKRIIVLKNSNNIGLARTLNHCLEKANGEYIARMDDDDYSHNNRLQIEVDFLDKHPEYSIVGTGRNMVDESGCWGKDTSYGAKSNIDIFKGNSFAHPTVMMRKSALMSVNFYSTNSWIGREEDTDLWCKLYAAGHKGYVINEVLFDYYESRDSMTRRKYKYRIVEFRIKMYYLKKLNVPFYMCFYAFKPLIVGLIPVKAMQIIHRRRFGI